MQTSAAVVNADEKVFRAQYLQLRLIVLQRLAKASRCISWRDFRSINSCQTSTSILKPISLLHKRSGSPRGP